MLPWSCIICFIAVQYKNPWSLTTGTRNQLYLVWHTVKVSNVSTCEIYKSPVRNFEAFIQNLWFFRSFENLILRMYVKLQISELIWIMTLLYSVLNVEENYYADYSLHRPSEKQLLPHSPHSLTFEGNQHLPYTPHSCALEMNKPVVAMHMCSWLQCTCLCSYCHVY
jgi:hypothetical protein